MLKTNLVQLLKSFTAYEMNSFGKFLSSPFFNKSEKIVSYFGILEKGHPQFISEAMNKEKYSKRFSPGKNMMTRKCVISLMSC